MEDKRDWQADMEWAKIMSSGEHEGWTKPLIYWLQQYAAEKEQADRLRESIEKCLTAGNSLASVIISYELPNGYESWSQEDAISYFYEEYGRDIAYEHYEIWLAWKAIKDVSASLYPKEATE